MDDFDDLSVVVKKSNRQKKLSPKTHTTEVGSLPPSGEHTLSRKELERLRKKQLEELLRK